MAATTTKTVKKSVRTIKENLAGMQLLGEIITWNARSESTHTHVDVVNALKDVGLDPEIARSLLPRFAFARATRKMATDRLIDAVNETEDTIVFQFTRKFMEQEELKFQKECYLRLNKITGVVTCEDKKLKELAQAELDKAMDVRTTNDITKIVQRLFEMNADLFPVRDQGGVYFVPAEHGTFTAQVESFLVKLHGSMTRFPVPAGTQLGNRAVQESVASALEGLIKEHNFAVDSFTLNTRTDTLENAAAKIRATKVKIQAYANYLQERSADLLKEVDAADAKLIAQVQALSEQRAAAPAKSADGKLLFGHAITAVIRWMGANQWTFENAELALYQQNVQVAPATIRAQLAAGRKGQRGEPAKLSKDQVDQLGPKIS